MQTLKKLFYILSKSEKKRLLLLLVLIIIMAIMEMIGVASILPFIAILMNQELIDTNFYLNTLFNYSQNFGVITKSRFLLIIGFAVFILLMISLSLKALVLYIQSKFTSFCNYNITKRLVEIYLNQPYSWFLNRHSADLGKNILSEASILVSGGLGPLMLLITNLIVSTALIFLLTLTNPKLTSILFFTIGGIYFLVFKITKKAVTEMGENRLIANKWLFKEVNEAFGATKEIKLGDLESVFTKRFSAPAKSLANFSAKMSLFRAIPRYLIEASVFGGMLLITLYLITNHTSFLTIIPVISLYAYAGYRLIPAMQNIYVSFTSLRYASPTIDTIYRDIKYLKNTEYKKNYSSINFTKNINLKNVSYNYPKSSLTALKNITINISANSFIGIIGKTGCGKTTTVDIILGLLDPQKGSLIVDDVIINKHNKKAWQKNIGYVPQNIFLTDDTVAANIAFGIQNKDIDYKALEIAAKIARLHDFVTK
jgi:ABC-type multidrug transport system fused ATPase/permease subunit